MFDAEELMDSAIARAIEGIERGQSPFGCAIAWDGRQLACEHNRVVETNDITAHAEITALRHACRARGHFLLEGSVAASTCEPCPMCMAALHWARVETVYYGATIADAARAGFHELQIPAAEVVQRGGSHVKLDSGVLSQKCRELFERWQARPDKIVY